MKNFISKVKKHTKKILIGLGFIGIASAAIIMGTDQPIEQPIISIESQLIGKTALEKANIKSEAISKLNFVGIYTDLGITVEIQSLKKIEIRGQSGVEILARAWKGKDILGFGDGTEEWGRFRIYNPPIMVDDPNGTIIREQNISTLPHGVIPKNRILREDPLAAIKSTLAHTIKVSSKPFTGTVFKGTNSHTFDTNLRFTGATSPLASDYTAGAGSTVLVLGIVVKGSTARAGGAPTYNGVNLTQANSTRIATETNVEMWYLLDPPTGSAYSISVPNTGTLTLHVQASTYKARSSYYTSVFDTSNGGTDVSANPTLTATSTVDGAVFVAVIGTGDNTFAPTARAGILLNETDNGIYGDGNQYLLQATAGAQAMFWTEATADDWAIVVAAFKEIVRPGYINTTVYANADDDDIGVNGTVWATVHDATTGTLRTGTTNYVQAHKGNGTADTYHLVVYFASFDTSALGTDTIDSADFSVKGLSKNGTIGSYKPYNSTHSDTIVAEDFDLRGSTAWGDTSITKANWSTTGLNTWGFNANGKSGINKTGLTKLCIREVEYDVANVAPPLDTNEYVGLASADTAGTADDPKLMVVHSAAAVPVTGAQIIIFE